MQRNAKYRFNHITIDLSIRFLLRSPGACHSLSPFLDVCLRAYKCLTQAPSVALGELWLHLLKTCYKWGNQTLVFYQAQTHCQRTGGTASGILKSNSMHDHDPVFLFATTAAGHGVTDLNIPPGRGSTCSVFISVVQCFFFFLLLLQFNSLNAVESIFISDLNEVNKCLQGFKDFS